MIRLHIKTQVWTGNIDMRSEILQSTSIMGSLRWWFELTLRAMDKYICDPTSEDRCPKQEENQNSHYCHACLVFGATEIRRTFRLNIAGGKKTFNRGIINIIPAGSKKGWYFGNGLKGEIKLSITPLDKDFDKNLIIIPLIIASKYGAIGAKTQLGYGVVKIENLNMDFNKFKETIEKFADQKRLSKLGINLREGYNNRLPNLKEMFFTKVQFNVSDNWWKKVNGIAPRSKNKKYRGYINHPKMIEWISSGSVPIMPAIKNWLRYKEGKKLWESKNSNQNKNIANWLFGTIKNEKAASKINISNAYIVNNDLWEFRVWGWIPKNDLPSGFNRNNFLDQLIKALNGKNSIEFPWNSLLGNGTKNHIIKVWREFGSSRDTIRPNEHNIENYIQSLLTEEV
ncbi:MAG: type III-B CRISPR module RAMP protein Cmr1 [Candidatus Helarchaeota archaeon]